MADVFRQKYRELTIEETYLIDNIKQAAQHLHDMIEACGPSRESSLAKTKLEESVFWAVKGVTSS